ncbi:hypothetical protein [Janthinobacterium sp. LB2P70]|uniref:hypothetical protein n=1 Tax=Janthinobacterium sp. LB2P70 TaxID=3424197 RepID=UPI003F295C69
MLINENIEEVQIPYSTAHMRHQHKEPSILRNCNLIIALADFQLYFSLTLQAPEQAALRMHGKSASYADHIT